VVVVGKDTFDTFLTLTNDDDMFFISKWADIILTALLQYIHFHLHMHTHQDKFTIMYVKVYQAEDGLRKKGGVEYWRWVGGGGQKAI
jgi:hypothetical protein